MPVQKFAISVPVEVMREVDRAAARKRTTRSAFITDVLRRIARARSDAEITRRVDALFSDPALAVEQKETAAAYRSRRRRRGAEW